MDQPESESLALLPLVEARPRIVGPTSLRVLRPAYPALGLGTLRVLRARERDGVTEIVAGYDGYARLGERVAAAHA